MRARELGVLVSCFAWSGGCQQTAPAPSASSASAATSASAGASCEAIRQDLRKEQLRLAKLPQSCTTNNDCELYGGHECPNALVKICPDAVAKSSAQALRPLEDAWEAQRCGEILWSPYHREAACEEGACVGR